MASFVLVHGSWQAARSWSEIVPRLAAYGHHAIAIDLPGHGQDRTPASDITFQHYVDRTLREIHAATEPPILVGHSMGGAIVCQAAEDAPEQVRALVCLASLVPPTGANMLSFVEGFDPEYLAQILWAPDRRSARLSEVGVRQFWCPECPPSIVDPILPLLGDEPAAPYDAPLSLTEANFGRVPRFYIECLRDRIVPIAMQRAMREAVSFTEVYSLDTGHGAYFSMPEELTQILHQIAERL